MKILRYLSMAVGVVLVLGLSAPYLGTNYFRGRIERTLAADLNRKVSIGKTRFNLFTGPGFTVEDVVIEEDPRIGIEPFATVSEVDARVDFVSLFLGELKFSSLRLVEPKVNFVKTNEGEWNIRLFMDRAEARRLPGISMTEGRLYLKFGDRKSNVRLEDAEGDIVQSSDGRVKLSISGEPFRSDRSDHGFGRMALRGNYAASKVDFSFELHKTPIQDFVKLFDGREMGLKGFIESDAHLTGPLEHVDVKGELKTSELANRLFLPSGGSGTLPYTGRVNFVSPEAEFQSTGGGSIPLQTNIKIANFLKDPDWTADMKMESIAFTAVVEMLRQLGFTLPAGMDVKGQMGGSLKFAKGSDTEGDFVLESPVVQLPNGGVVENVPLRLEFAGPGVSMKAHTEAETATAPSKVEVEGKYDLDSKGLTLIIVSRGLRISETKKLFGPLPLLAQFVEGVWHGGIRYSAAGNQAEPLWNGVLEVAQAQIEVPGIADPVVVSFHAAVDGARAGVRNLRGRVGKIDFAGDYRYEPGMPRPHRANVVVTSPVNAVELERLWKPTLVRNAGFLARLTRASVPDWLRERQAEGTVRFEALTTGNWTWGPAEAGYRWSGTSVQFTKIRAQAVGAGGGAVEGEGSIDLSGTVPVYSANGFLKNAAYKSGSVDVKGKITSRGVGGQVLDLASAIGNFEGEDVRYVPEAMFDRITGAFQLGFGTAAVAQTKVTAVEAVMGGEGYKGKGSYQPDGRFVLELESGSKQQRLVGSLFGAAAPLVTTPQ